MEKRELPSQLVWSEFEDVPVFVLIALFPLIITITVFLGMYLTGTTRLDEWRIPLLGLLFISMAAFLTGLMLEFGLRQWHTYRIKQIYDEKWAVWEKFSSDEKWRNFTETEYQSQINDIHFEFAPLIIVGIILLIIGIAVVVNDADVSIVFGLIGFMIIVLMIVAGRWLTAKWRTNNRYKRRKNAPIPAIIISPNGYYDEDEGFTSLRRLQSIDVNSSPKKQSMKINFLVKAHWLEYFLTDEHVRHNQWTVTLNMPKAYEEEAEALLTRFKTELLKK